MFAVESALLGAGLAMDAFSVSVADGLNAPDMPVKTRLLIPGVFAAFQFFMPLAGWLCVSVIADTFAALRPAIPRIAFGLLAYIGAKMLLEGLDGGGGESALALNLPTLLMQGLATSIDALSAGFTLVDLPAGKALAACGIIAGVTFGLCALGLRAGRRFGARLSGRACAAGGAILIGIGIKILFSA